MPHTAEPDDGLIDAYLNDGLTDVERAAFELMMLEDAQLFTRVQLLAAFKDSLVAQRAALRGKSPRATLRFRAWLEQPLSLAATMLVLALGLQLVYDNVYVRAEFPAAVGIDSVLVLNALSGTKRPSLSGAPPYLFRIDAGPAAANMPAVFTLRSADGAELLQVDGVPVDANGRARIVFDQALAGAYTIELAPSANPSAITRFDLAIND